MATRAVKKREVLFRIESVEHFQEKLDPENNQKLLCKSITIIKHLCTVCLTVFVFLKALMLIWPGAVAATQWSKTTGTCL